MTKSQVKQLSVKYSKLRRFSLKRKEVVHGEEKRIVKRRKNQKL